MDTDATFFTKNKLNQTNLIKANGIKFIKIMHKFFETMKALQKAYYSKFFKIELLLKKMILY